MLWWARITAIRDEIYWSSLKILNGTPVQSCSLLVLVVFRGSIRKGDAPVTALAMDSNITVEWIMPVEGHLIYGISTWQT